MRKCGPTLSHESVKISKLARRWDQRGMLRIFKGLAFHLTGGRRYGKLGGIANQL
jgi:hypothetical protein